MLSRQKLLFLHHGGEMYGSDKMFLEAVRALASEFDALIVLDSRGPLVEELESIPVRVIIHPLGVMRRKNLTPLGVLRWAGRIGWATAWLLSTMREERVDAVYTSTLAILTGAIAARLHRKRHVWHVHEIITAPAWFARTITFLALNLSEKTIVPSECTATHLARGKGEASRKITVVHNGVDVGPYDDVRGGQIRAELGIRPETFLIGLIGRIHFWKGQDFLLQAAAQMSALGTSDFKILLVGGVFPGYEGYMQRLRRIVAASGLQDRVIFCGLREDVPEIVKDIDVLVVPSVLPEPFALVALEGMAGGKPVVATNNGGMAEIVEDGMTGLLVSPSDSAALARCLVRLAHNPEERLEMGRLGRSRVEKLFSLEQYREGIRNVVMEAVLSAAR